MFLRRVLADRQRACMRLGRELITESGLMCQLRGGVRLDFVCH